MTVVALYQGQIAGFANLVAGEAYFDRLYVHHAFQRKGIGSLLAEELEQQARRQGLSGLRVDASRTALGFFTHRGYMVQQTQQVERAGQRIENFVLYKALKAKNEDMA